MEKRTNEKSPNEGDFRLFLQKAFVDRCRKNPQYSLRAFAKSLSIGASPLSAILRGKRPITQKTKVRLGLALGLKLEEIKGFSETGASTTAQFQQISLDSYAIISDWYHYAILELIRINNFKPDIAFVSKALGISNTETQIAVERLQRVGLLEIEPNGKWLDTSFEGHATNISEDLTSHGSIKLQRQLLEKAIEALETLPTDERNHTSMTMAVNTTDLPEAKKRIKKFRRELCDFFEKNRKPNQVYNLNIALFPLTFTEKK